MAAHYNGLRPHVTVVKRTLGRTKILNLSSLTLFKSFDRNTTNDLPRFRLIYFTGFSLADEASSYESYFGHEVTSALCDGTYIMAGVDWMAEPELVQRPNWGEHDSPEHTPVLGNSLV